MNWGYSKKKEQSYIKTPKKPKIPNVKASTKPSGKKLKAKETKVPRTNELYDALGYFGIDPSGAIDNYPEPHLRKLLNKYRQEMKPTPAHSKPFLTCKCGNPRPHGKLGRCDCGLYPRKVVSCSICGYTHKERPESFCRALNGGKINDPATKNEIVGDILGKELSKKYLNASNLAKKPRWSGFSKGSIVSIGQIDRYRPDLTLVTQDEEVRILLKDENRHVDEFDGVFVRENNGEIVEMWGFHGLPDLRKPAEKIL